MSRFSFPSRRAVRVGVTAAILLAAGLAAVPAAHAAVSVELTTSGGSPVAGDDIFSIAKITGGNFGSTTVEDDAKRGSIVITVYSGADCDTVKAVGNPLTVRGNGGNFKFTVEDVDAGAYSWRATLTQPHLASPPADVVSACTAHPTIGKHTPTLTTVATNAAAGGTVSNTATLANRFRPTANDAPGAASLTFALYAAGDTSCTGTPIDTSDAVVSINKNEYSSDKVDVAGAGTYRWKVNYSGDANNAAVTAGCGVGTSTVTGADTTPPPPARTPTCAGKPATIVGTKGKDNLRGTKGNDVIVAGGGADTVDGRGGNDLICGASGNDSLKGGAGADLVYGGPGADDVRGGSGNDKIFGAGGADKLSGGKGRDVANGGSGRDTITSSERTTG